MEEASLHYWIIPIISIIVVSVFLAFSLDYKYNTVFPNAVLEKVEIENMSCHEILLKDSSNRYWSKENAEIGKAKAIGCNPPKEAKSSGGNPYVEFCIPGGFAPDKKIDNSTHSFNHDTCVWDLK